MKLLHPEARRVKPQLSQRALPNLPLSAVAYLLPTNL